MANLEIKEEDLVLCTVERIESNTVFAKLEDGREATLIISEIAPGRIKNLREYVVPNKKIVCKVLRIQGSRVDISLRRVSSKDKKEFLETKAFENNVRIAFKQILKEKFEEVLENILNNYPSIKEFSEKSKEDKSLIKKYFPAESVELIEKTINKKQKDVEVKKIIKTKCLESNGISRIKEIFSSPNKEIEVLYLAAGTFQVKSKGEDYKQANQKLDLFTKDLENRSKKQNCEFEISNG